MMRDIIYRNNVQYAEVKTDQLDVSQMGISPGQEIWETVITYSDGSKRTWHSGDLPEASLMHNHVVQATHDSIGNILTNFVHSAKAKRRIRIRKWNR